ncbi:hypothetical protein FACS189490_13360 [Clostridia bacterium]|nr:hypothetical protein FACS189490_13360 [Clostridia bacterium]
MLVTDRLVSLRKEKKQTQAGLAEILGLERSTYVKYETSGIQPPAKMLVALASYFDVTTDYLLGLSDVKNASALVVPEVLSDVRVAFNRGEFEGLDQYEVDKLAEFANMVKEMRNKR